MKKYYIKIAAILLITVIFPMTSGSCLPGLLDPMIKTDFAQAASLDNKQANGTNVCGDEQTKEQVYDQVMPMPMKDHRNSLLPCCMDGGHSVIITNTQFIELGKLLPVMFFSKVQLFITVPKIFFDNSPIISPPELLSVKKTILRL